MNISLYSLKKGGYFPTTYSNNPEVVISNRKISRDRFLFNPKYELNNYNYNRSTELKKNYQVKHFNLLKFLRFY